MSKLLIALCLVATGCATTQQNYNDIARQQVDCANARIQIKYLEKQLTKPNADYGQTADQKRSYNATARDLIWRIREECNVQ